MKQIYASGPLADCNSVEARGWRLEAQKLLSPLLVLDPAERWAGGSYGHLTEHQKLELVAQDLVELERADAVLANCWKPSVGTSHEILYAWLWRKPVVVVSPSLSPSPWLVAHADTVVESVEQAVRWLKVKLM